HMRGQSVAQPMELQRLAERSGCWRPRDNYGKEDRKNDSVAPESLAKNAINSNCTANIAQKQGG
ncbi:hypothetical protein D478_27486, partial [Brevibacillus agri BAB-2500]